MDFEKLQDFAVANFSQYFSVTVNTLIQPTLHFAPVAVDESGREVNVPAGSVGSRLNPQLVAFAVLSMFLGLTMNSLITKTPGNRETFFLAEVVGLLFWVIYAVIVHMLCKVFRGKGSFYETVSVTIQIFATLYVLCSVVATMLAPIVLLKPIKPFLSGWE